MHGGKLLGIMAAHRCFSLLGYFKGAEQNTKQSTSKDKEASATTGCKDSEPKAKKERAFNEAWRKELVNVRRQIGENCLHFPNG